MTIQEFTEMALSFPGTMKSPHFDRTAFKIIQRRTFATLHEPSTSANIVLPQKDQSVFCAMSNHIYAVNNKWGDNGWTTFEIEKIDGNIILNALDTAYNHALAIRPKKK